MRWFRQLFGGARREAPDPAPEGSSEAAPDRWSGRLEELSEDDLDALLDELSSEPEAVQLDLLRRTRELLPRHLPLLLALARLGGSEAEALWQTLAQQDDHRQEATEWLLEAALEAGDRAEAARLSQRLLALAPGDPAALERALQLRDGLPLLPPPAAPTAYRGAPVLAPAPERVPAGFALRRRLGAGGFGTVYEAADKRFDRTVAIKFLHAHLGDDGAAVDGFRSEARCMAELDHPGVIRVFDIFPEQQALVLEYCAGGSLQDRLNVLGPIPRQARGLLAGPAATLVDAHSRGVVHGDLKPANLLFRDAAGDSRLVLTDFGAGVEIAGTEGYRAPEQTGATLAPGMDVFALGQILRRLLGADGDDDRLVRLCTGQDPATRPSMRAVAEALKPFAAHRS